MNTTQPQNAKTYTPIERLHQQFRFKGGLSLKYRRECIGMLPEIFRLKIHEKKGFNSIVEYAAKLAGISEKQTRLALNLEERFQDKPALHETLIKGEVSINKLARIVSIATPENEQDLVEKVKLLPQKALETYVRDQKQNGLFGTKNEAQQLRARFEKSRPGTTRRVVGQTFELEDDVKIELLELQHKGININDLLRKFLAQRRENLVKEKEQLAEEVHAKTEKQAQISQINAVGTKEDKSPGAQKPSRYIPTKIRKYIAQEHGTKCSIHTCHKPSQQIHHTQRFALAQNHDPHYLAPLCKEHHIVAHLIDQRYQQKLK